MFSLRVLLNIVISDGLFTLCISLWGEVVEWKEEEGVYVCVRVCVCNTGHTYHSIIHQPPNSPLSTFSYPCQQSLTIPFPHQQLFPSSTTTMEVPLSFLN